MTAKEYYTEHRQYGNRYKTDVQLTDVTDERKFSGIMDRHARFVEKHQLLSEEDWTLFVRQFATAPDDCDRGWRGEYFGKMMRGACMTYQYTKNEELYRVLTKAAEAMLETQDTLGRFSTYSLSCEFGDWDMWSRKYVLLGFLHFHEICRDESLKDRIIAALGKHLDYIVEHIGKDKTDLSETSRCWGGMNSASILEPVMRMYNLTGKESYLEFARYIVGYLSEGHVNIFSLALENRLMPYQYPETKAYEMMSCFEGLLEYYRVTGEEKWKTAVISFADSVKESDITVIGCAGCEHELFNHSAATQTDTDYKGIMQETCVTVTWMKLCNQLLLLTGEAKYADYIEHSLYNALHGAVNSRLNTTNGGFVFDSYSPLTADKRGRAVGGYKTISDTKHYGCCAAIGAAGTALPLLSAVTATEGGVAVNFYEEGSVKAGGFELDVMTEYPLNGNVRIKVTDAARDARLISIRIPEFSGIRTKLSVNGKPQTIAHDSTEGFYIHLNKEWTSGDVIDITFDMSPRTLRPCGVDGKPETKEYFAVLYGPLVLARDAQITEVGTPVRLSDKLELTLRDKGGFDCTVRAKVLVGETELDMIDYGSAGKTWDESSLTEAWIKCF